MKNDITKYIRELFDIATILAKVAKTATMEPTISQPMREDLLWELSRLRSSFADSIAALIELNSRYTETAET